MSFRFVFGSPARARLGLMLGNLFDELRNFEPE